MDPTNSSHASTKSNTIASVVLPEPPSTKKIHVLSDVTLTHKLDLKDFSVFASSTPVEIPPKKNEKIHKINSR